jgi:hypothetical protein
MTAQTIYLATIWIIPILIAITFHEAAHGFVAHLWEMIQRGGSGESASIP